MSIRFGISMILLIFAKFLRMRKLFWIVAANLELPGQVIQTASFVRGPSGPTYEAKTPAPARSRPPRQAGRLVRPRLLDLDGGPRRFQHLGELVDFLLRKPLFHQLGSAFDEVLGLLEAEARDGSDLLDDVDLLFSSSLEPKSEL